MENQKSLGFEYASETITIILRKTDACFFSLLMLSLP